MEENIWKDYKLNMTYIGRSLHQHWGRTFVMCVKNHFMRMCCNKKLHSHICHYSTFSQYYKVQKDKSMSFNSGLGLLLSLGNIEETSTQTLMGKYESHLNCSMCVPCSQLECYVTTETCIGEAKQVALNEFIMQKQSWKSSSSTHQSCYLLITLQTWQIEPLTIRSKIHL